MKCIDYWTIPDAMFISLLNWKHWLTIKSIDLRTLTDLIFISLWNWALALTLGSIESITVIDTMLISLWNCQLSGWLSNAPSIELLLTQCKSQCGTGHSQVEHQIYRFKNHYWCNVHLSVEFDSFWVNIAIIDSRIATNAVCISLWKGTPSDWASKLLTLKLWLIQCTFPSWIVYSLVDH